MAYPSHYGNLDSPGPLLLSLPPDLLELLGNPASPQPAQPQDMSKPQDTTKELPMSPLSPQLQTDLFTLPEQLLNMIQALPDENKPLKSPFSPLPDPEKADYVNATPLEANEAEYVEVSSLHDGSQSDYVVDTPPEQEEESIFNYVPMSPAHEGIQPDYVEVTHQQMPEESDTHYTPMSPPPDSIQPDYVEVAPTASQQNESSSLPTSPPPRLNSDASEYSNVPLLQDTDQPEYEDMPTPQPDYEDVPTPQPDASQTLVSQHQLPTPPDVTVALPQAQAPEEENYATVLENTESAEDTGEHVYEPLPPPRATAPEEPGQAVYADVPDPPAPPPSLPPRARSLPPEQEPDREPPPPVPPRPTSPTTQQPEPTTPQPNYDQEVPTPQNMYVMAPEPATDAAPVPDQPRSQVEDGVAALENILQELQRGNANDPRASIELSLPPQYDDLSQAPRYLDATVQAAASQREALIIPNTNAERVAQRPQGPIRADNINIRYEMGDREHHRNKTIKKTQTILWLCLSILLALIWLMLVVPLSAAALVNALNEIKQDRAPLVPSCHYSVPLLLVVLLAQVLAAAFVIYWFSKCCKCARTKKASRLATSLTAVTATIYGIIIIAFAVSVFVFVNRRMNSSSDEPSTTEAATTENTQPSNSEVCIETSSPPFLFATFYLLALLLFLILSVLMTCCDYHYKRKQKNFLLYLKDTVRIYENEATVDEETEL
jgi:hypothetical protein